jgi:hypothetical protein
MISRVYHLLPIENAKPAWTKHVAATLVREIAGEAITGRGARTTTTSAIDRQELRPRSMPACLLRAAAISNLVTGSAGNPACSACY